MTAPPSVPLLIVIAGPARGRSVPVDRGITIGRDDGNTLHIADPALSRHHCAVDASGARLMIRDLGSRNGVFVNARPVTESALSDGDQIRIGDSALVVVSAAGVESHLLPEPPTRLDDTPLPLSSTVAVVGATARYTGESPAAPGRGEAPAAVRVSARAARELAALLHLSETLHAAASVGALVERVLEATRTLLPDATPLVVAGRDDDLRVLATPSAAGAAPSIRRPLVTQALQERAATQVADAMAVPLSTGDAEPLLLYITSPTRRFTEADLPPVAAVGSIAGLALARVQQLAWLEDESARLRQDAAIAHDLVGDSPAMQAVYRFIARVAPTGATVLLRGESGTGKELVAQAIHRNSPRARGPFVPINCAALPDALLESELFGHERGAFTGALSQQRGRLEMADRGTVFLDEIGELAPPLQAKLLRVLQDRIVERLGARRGIKIDVRVIAATNRDLEAGMTAGTFRQDLYYRLNVVSVTVPPLRDRREDLPLLAAYFVRQHAERCTRAVKGIAPPARAVLAGYDWPGNVRELSNAIERAVVLGSSDVILPEDLPEALLESAAAQPEAATPGFHGQVAAHKRELIQEALERSGGNVAKAARELALQPTYLHRLIRNLGVRSGG